MCGPCLCVYTFASRICRYYATTFHFPLDALTVYAHKLSLSLSLDANLWNSNKLLSVARHKTNNINANLFNSAVVLVWRIVHIEPASLREDSCGCSDKKASEDEKESIFLPFIPFTCPFIPFLTLKYFANNSIHILCLNQSCEMQRYISMLHVFLWKSVKVSISSSLTGTAKN